MKRILVGMSGGVDSAVSVLLLKEMGYEVGGATMLLQPCGQQEAADASESANRLGIPFHLFDWQREFREQVIKPFEQVYMDGSTPNPCIFCNIMPKCARRTVGSCSIRQRTKPRTRPICSIICVRNS